MSDSIKALCKSYKYRLEISRDNEFIEIACSKVLTDSCGGIVFIREYEDGMSELLYAACAGSWLNVCLIE